MKPADTTRFAVPLERLRRTIDPRTIENTPEIEGVIDQEQAMAALDVGLGMTGGGYEQSHYNVMVVGPDNTGRIAKTLQHLRERAAEIDSVPPDVLCLHNFSDHRRPTIIFVPGGTGIKIRDTLKCLEIYASNIWPEDMETFRQARVAEAREKFRRLWAEAAEQIKPLGFVPSVSEDGSMFEVIPFSLTAPDKLMEQEEFDKLGDQAKQELEEKRAAAHVICEKTHMTILKLVADMERALKQQPKKRIQELAGEQLDRIRRHAPENAGLEKYLAGLEKHILERCLAGKPQTPDNPFLAAMMSQQGGMDGGKAFSLPFKAKVLVNNIGAHHPPVIQAKVPKYSHVFGKIRYQMTKDGGVQVDHTHVESCALLRANGGVLLFDLDDLYAWGGTLALYKLIETVQRRELTIESKGSFVDADIPIDYRPHSVPLNVRIVVVCSRRFARALQRHLPQFANLFRIIAEFDHEMGADEASSAYRSFVEICRKDCHLPEFAPEAIALLVEYGLRRAGDQRKASAEFGIIKDLITEAAFWAQKAKAAKIGAEHVQKAIDARYNRQALVVRKYQEHHDHGIIIRNDGAAVGRINALAVLQVSNEVRFGTVLPVTARTFAGKNGVVLVQREANLSGPTTDMATAIIRGYLSGQYGQKKPLSLSSQICFEQCYNGIDGPSATLAELIVLISSITGLPVDQRLVITGAMGQWGEAQLIGGVNEKIEGHFGFLKRQDLLKQGGHGAVIPKHNLVHLMLDREVIEAQKQGLYQVYAVETIDEALEIFLGHPAAEIHKLVEEKLNGVGVSAKTVGAVRGFFRKLFPGWFRRETPKKGE